MADFIAQNLSKSVGEKTVFNQINFIIHDLDRIGLLGVNGTGKTTLLNVISGLSGFDGDRTPFDHPQNYKITYLTQEPDFNPKATILDTVLDDSLPQMRAIKNYEAALLDYENLAKLERAQSEMDALNAWQVEADVKTILTKLQLPDPATLIESLSGGQKRRVQLAQALVNDSDLLLLDEPTNHLDVETIAWLQNYLKNSRRTVLFVTHDRYFLDNVATRIFELEDAGLKEYQGNYQDYLAKKAEDEEREAAASHKAKQLYQSELTWIRKSPQARATKQQARIDRFEDLKDSMKTSKNLGDLELNIASSRLGKKVINFKNAAFSYPDRPIFKDFELIVQGHSRLGIVGDNGVGKSTLLNIIDGELALTDGILEIGETVKIGYFSQEIRGLDENKRMINFLEEVASAAHNSSGENISIVNLLEQFLFPRSSHGTLISKLSGGEKKRLYLLKILLLQPNVLLLDEPTNDLDIATLTVLENFLGSFPGAVLTVSHDRYFQDKVSNELLAFEDGQINHYFGAYSDYLAVKMEEKSADKAVSKIESPISTDKTENTDKTKLTYMEKKEWETIESQIAEIEERISEIDTEMNENGSNTELLLDLQKELDNKTKELEEKYERWEYLSERAD
ncbi:ABC-F family ATP-binding cassette domain-containing protein [Lactococcus lactis]|jgi:ATP-binding cassette subfamily F protein uup|uniref:ABC-F family ATP-binding cassette domain-containing protein n=1 Tax=Lactococcus lactis TaxID=1358 RepID=A0AAP5UBH4_9LACT|nr:ABC-F family ATP-binding cassette domain-containing protein [Lactococcus lactis]MDT2860601.1 ABC-F family ATP-binding cassette domain-containing protein [Lactococcus lactis]MDT2861120.1 ABC-F family ATP-binding cassette domain-containing protein [Lactococcus lactis]MDT2867043.1 ABC-F family ATP-binding cassette domain-containing protein [Lactococcus lactis]MDT2871635.1 ABC-F family ATP-binding cassette domain-containing protein [Lactococcus lactis]MDT2871774.1 ABC-F family ATP-binding casse